MSNILLKNATKKYNDGKVIAVNDLTIECGDKELIAILGPSGAGKTSTLKMIAGIEAITEGSLYINGRDVTKLPPQDRNISMVFESYALYPHLTVKENLAFPLYAPCRSGKMTKEEKEAVVEELAETVGLGELLDRKPSQLSGGQRQRVSLARALVRAPEPNVILMDEPIAHLDAKLRNSMRAELKRLHKDLGATIIYVTHDYVEAMGMADRIIILNEGRIMQQGTPEEIYFNPVNEFVAASVGEPPMNFMNGELTENNGKTVFTYRSQAIELKDRPSVLGGADIGIRPTEIRASKEKPAGKCFTGEIRNVLPTGAKQIMEVSVDNKLLRIKIHRDLSYQIGDRVYLQPETKKLCIFDPKTKARIDYREGGGAIG
jgi:multiple sugar transport system ATP-binding protein